jgi:hypothetical protein
MRRTLGAGVPLRLARLSMSRIVTVLLVGGVLVRLPGDRPADGSESLK